MVPFADLDAPRNSGRLTDTHNPRQTAGGTITNPCQSKNRSIVRHNSIVYPQPSTHTTLDPILGVYPLGPNNPSEIPSALGFLPSHKTSHSADLQPVAAILTFAIRAQAQSSDMVACGFASGGRRKLEYPSLASSSHQ